MFKVGDFGFSDRWKGKVFDMRKKPCPVCSKRELYRCDDCGVKYKALSRDVGLKELGHSGVEDDHFHVQWLGEIVAKGAVAKDLCYKCYCKDWKRVYPKQKVPI